MSKPSKAARSEAQPSEVVKRPLQTVEGYRVANRRSGP